MDPLYPWYEVAHQIAKTNGWTETEELNLSTDINKSIQTGDLNCWLPDGRPLSFNDAGVPLAKQGKSIYELSNKQLQPIPHLTAKAINDWLDKKGYLPKWTPTFHSLGKPKQSEAAIKKELTAKIQALALSIIKRQSEKDLYPNQICIADEIAKELRKSGTMGLSGKPMAGSHIKRHFMKGINSSASKRKSTTKHQGK